MEGWIMFVLMLGAVEMKSLNMAEPKEVQHVKRETVCFTKLGCFSTDPPFTSPGRPVSVVPESPDQNKIKFYLFSTEHKATYQYLDPRRPEDIPTAWTRFKASRPTKIIVHGFLDSPFVSDWLFDMKNEFLKHGDYNVIVVDWQAGNQLPYNQATANTRVVGAQLALTVNELIKSQGAKAGDFHIIGHSLGAHIAGYTGERVPGLGRITGLDPAGPNYDNTDILVRLDPSDAVYVDTIHSDADILLHLGMGMRDAVGHADFFPNGGHNQPECTRDPVQNILNYGFVEGTTEVVACNHLRANRYFIESINSQCPFLAFPCPDETSYKNHRCLSCSGSGCSKMGFHSDENIPPEGQHIKYYLTTSGHKPYCQYHLDVTVKFSANGNEEKGVMSVLITGSSGSTGRINLHDPSNPVTYQPGKTYKFFLGVPNDIGSVTSVNINFDHKSSLLDPLHWNPLGLRNPTIYVDEIDVFREEAQEDVHFCARHLALQENKAVTLGSKC